MLQVVELRVFRRVCRVWQRCGGERWLEALDLINDGGAKRNEHLKQKRAG